MWHKQFYSGEPCTNQNLYGWFKKFLAPLAFPYWSALDTELSTKASPEIPPWDQVFNRQSTTLHNGQVACSKASWPCLIIKVLAIWANFLEPSGYCIVINCAFMFCTTNVFGCSCDVMNKFLNYAILHVHLCGFQIPHRVEQCTMCQCTNYHYTINHSEYLPWLELLQSYDICMTN